MQTCHFPEHNIQGEWQVFLWFTYIYVICYIISITVRTKKVMAVIIRLDMQSELPIYTQLVNQIIEGIASGRLKPGEPLPSVRSLASDIGINLHTVNKAYTLLKQDGFILVHRQKGVVINPDGMPGITEDYRSKMSGELKPIAAEAICRGMNREQLLLEVERIYQEITQTDKEND